MKDENETALEIGRWAKYAMKQGHLALDLHSSSYFQTDIILIIQYIGHPPPNRLYSSRNMTDALCEIWAG
jgi:hypothetical protein